MTHSPRRPDTDTDLSALPQPAARLQTFVSETRARLDRLRTTVLQLSIDIDGIAVAADVATAPADPNAATPRGMALQRAVTRAGLTVREVCFHSGIPEVRMEVLAAGASPTSAEFAALCKVLGGPWGDR